jgi:hypothetical protein
MEDKKRYTKIDPTQYVQYTGPTRRYPRVNPFEKKIITPEQNKERNKDQDQDMIKDQAQDLKEAEKKAGPEQENKDAAAAKD